MKPLEPQDASLASLLGEARDRLAGQQAPPRVAQAMWSAFDARVSPAPAPRRPRRIAVVFGWALGAASVAASVAALLIDPRPPEADATRAIATAFLPVAAPERWREFSEAPDVQRAAWVVDAELPRASLAGMGLPYDPARAAEPVRAELLLHPAGDVLAVRFVNE
jgi:hypothetical protein